LFRKHSNLFVQILKHDEEDIRIIAIESLLDCLCKFGIYSLVEEENEAEKSRQSLSSFRFRKGDSSIRLPEMEPLESDNQEEGDDDDDDEERATQESQEKSNQTLEENDLNITLTNKDLSRFFDSIDRTCERELIDSITNLLMDQLISSEYDSIKKIAAEGIGKLMILGVIFSQQLLSKLIIIWYLPDIPRFITQFLGVFIPIYVGSETYYLQKEDGMTVTGQTCLLECIIETITTIYEIKFNSKESLNESRLNRFFPFLEDSSQLASIDIKNMMSFMLELLSKENHGLFLSRLCHKMLDILSLCEEDYLKMEDLLMDYLIKAALRLEFDNIESTQSKELKVLLNNVLHKIKARLDSMSSLNRKRAERFIRSLQDLLKRLYRNESRVSILSQDLEAGERTIVASEAVTGDEGEKENKDEAETNQDDNEGNTNEAKDSDSDEKNSDEEEKDSDSDDEDDGDLNDELHDELEEEKEEEEQKLEDDVIDDKNRDIVSSDESDTLVTSD